MMESVTHVDRSEYAPYYDTYVRRVPDGDIAEILSGQVADTLSLLGSVPANREDYRYEPGKWSVREVVGHMIDTERIFAFRALAIARGEGASLPGMDQDEYAAASNAGSRSLSDLAAEFAAVRTTTVALFGGLSAEAWSRQGIASECSFTVRSIAFIIAGHEIHHRTGLEENYMSGLNAGTGG